MRIAPGFTLIELLITLAISAILLSVAYPSYVHYEVRAERNRATVALMQMAAKLEMYFNDHASYSGATIDSLGATALIHGIPYQLAITSATDQHFSIAAIPIDEQAKRDTVCGELMLTDTNLRSDSGTGNVDSCWG